MSNIISDYMEHKRHMAILKQHCHDARFPLDGSQWARLVADRMHREQNPDCRCHNCHNFLTRLHTIDSPLEHEHRVTTESMDHWFFDDLVARGRAFDLAANESFVAEGGTLPRQSERNVSDTERALMRAAHDYWFEPTASVYKAEEHIAEQIKVPPPAIELLKEFQAREQILAEAEKMWEAEQHRSMPRR